MRILMLTGASRSVIWFRKELIKYLQDRGHSITVVSCDNEFKEEIEKLSVKFICSGGDNRDTGIKSNLRYIKVIKNIVEKEKPDKIMTFQAKANTFGVLASAKTGCQDIYSMVEGLGNVFNRGGIKSKILKFISQILYRKAFRKVKTVFFLNSQNQDYMIKSKIVRPEQCCIINGIGVDLEYFKKTQSTNFDIIKFVMVARVEQEKGVLEFCETAKAIKENGLHKAEFNYYGTCDSKENIIEKYAKDGYVNYHGYTNDIRRVLNENHIFVLPSYYNEGLPRSIMEAMSTGKAIITTDMPGCKETTIDGYNGLLVNIKDANDLCMKMQYLIDNSDKITVMGNNSRKLCEEKFDCNIINEKILRRIQ